MSLVKEIMNMKKLNVTLAILVAAVMAGNAEPPTTDPVGYSSTTMSAGQYIYSPTFVKNPTYQGSGLISDVNLPVSGVTADQVNPTSFTDNRPNYPKAYVEILSGSYAGIAYDITSSTSNSVGCADLPSELSGTTVNFVIRPHVILSDLITPSSGFAEYSDSISVYNQDGTVSLRLFAGGIVTLDDFETDAGHTPIYPGNAILININGPVTLTSTGVVKTTITKVPVYQNVNNFVGLMNPSSNIKATSTTLASSLAAYSDSATIYSDDGLFALQKIVLTDGTDVTDDNFAALTTANDPTIKIGNGMIVNVNSDGYIVLNPAYTRTE